LTGQTSAGVYVRPRVDQDRRGGAYTFTGLQPGVYNILLLSKPVYHESLWLIGVVPGTVNGQTDGIGQNEEDSGAIANISLGANAAGVNYNFFNNVNLFEGG